MTRHGDPDPNMDDIMDELFGAERFTSMEDVNRLMAQRVQEYNTRPQADLGGLSPDQMYQVLHGDWKSEGALRLNESLSPDDLAGSAFLTNARALLEYIETEGPVKETAAGNLTRAAVASLLPRLRTSDGQLASEDLPPSRKTDEGDVTWLTDLRYVLIFGKLLARRKGLRITPLGRQLRARDRAGELYSHLFRTFFRVLDLRALDGGGHSGLQPSLAYSFFKLGSAARKWTSSQTLAEQAWLESAMDPPTQSDLAYGDHRFFAFKHSVLDPLVQFGLLESRSGPREALFMRGAEYRCTPLYARFLRFEFRRD